MPTKSRSELKEELNQLRWEYVRVRKMNDQGSMDMVNEEGLMLKRLIEITKWCEKCGENKARENDYCLNCKI